MKVIAVGRHRERLWALVLRPVGHHVEVVAMQGHRKRLRLGVTGLAGDMEMVAVRHNRRLPIKVVMVVARPVRALIVGGRIEVPGALSGIDIDATPRCLEIKFRGSRLGRGQTHPGSQTTQHDCQRQRLHFETSFPLKNVDLGF